MEIGPFKSRAGYISYGEIDQWLWYEEVAFLFTVEGQTENQGRDFKSLDKENYFAVEHGMFTLKVKGSSHSVLAPHITVQ